MLDIIILYFLANNIGKLAIQKGESASRWKVYTILAWIAGGIIGIFIGVSVLGYMDMLRLILVYYPLAIAGYHIVKNTLSRKPDAIDIDSLGNDINSTN